MRVITSFILVLISCVMSAQSKYEVISSTNLNVRSAPDAKAKVVGSLKPGEIVWVSSISDGWAEIAFMNKSGYAVSRFLKVAEVQEETIQSDSIVRRFVYEVASTSRLNVRNRPSTQSQILGSLPPGYIIEAGEETGDWLKFSYNGTEAYVSLKFLRHEEIVEQIIVESVQDEPESVVEEPVLVEENVEIEASKNLEIKLPDFMKATCLIEKPCLLSDKFDLFMAGRVGFGLSSYTWTEGDVNGKMGLSLGAVAQMYWKENRTYYMEASVGYAVRGAAKLPMHYLSIGVAPFGYYYDYNDFRLVGSGGLYFGIPLSALEYVDLSKLDIGVSLGAAVEYNLLSFGLEFDHGFVNISTTDVKLYNWSLMAKITCKIISFNK